MATYRVGSVGAEVSRLQARLKELGHYGGPVDGAFGGGTEAAVRAFQKAKKLDVDGAVGPVTWGALFAAEKLPAPAVINESLGWRCLAMTGSFETGAPIPECFAGLSGDFDGQGLSFGALQWNIGQGSLQPLLVTMQEQAEAVVRKIFGDRYAEYAAMLKASQPEQLAWVRGLQAPGGRLAEPWAGYFKTLGRTGEFQAIEVKAAKALFDKARLMAKTYGVTSERAVALFFDIVVQNGSISKIVQAQILADIARLPALKANEAEVARLRIIAIRRAEASNPQWIADVRARKLAIAEGVGVVHGRHVDLKADFGISLQPFA